MSANYVSNCASGDRCLECPIELLEEADDRVWAKEITRAVLNDPANADLQEASITKITDAVMHKAATLHHYTLGGVVLGAVVLSLDNRCVRF